MTTRGRALLLLPALALTLAAAACSSAAPVHARLAFTRPTITLDGRIGVRISDLPAHATVRVTASTRDAEAVPWSSSATYVASSAGVVSLADAPTHARYDGKDAMGLFQTLEPTRRSPTGEFEVPYSGYRVELTARISSRIVAHGSFRRELVTPTTAVRRLRPARDGIYADLFVPHGASARRPAVLDFGGSDGGLQNLEASQLANHGYVVLSLAYFDEPGLPAQLSHVPLEYFARALRLLGRQPDVDPHRIVIEGVSRGGEAALLVAATYPHMVSAVVAGVPSSTLNTGYPDVHTYAWTLHGHPLTYRTLHDATDGSVLTPDLPSSIRVERIRGPLLMDCAGEDAVWNSCAFVGLIQARLREHHDGYPVTALHYPDAGHLVGEFVPAALFDQSENRKLGGSPAITQTDLVDAEGHLLHFLAGLRAVR